MQFTIHTGAQLPTVAKQQLVYKFNMYVLRVIAHIVSIPSTKHLNNAQICKACPPGVLPNKLHATLWLQGAMVPANQPASMLRDGDAVEVRYHAISNTAV